MVFCLSKALIAEGAELAENAQRPISGDPRDDARSRRAHARVASGGRQNEAPWTAEGASSCAVLPMPFAGRPAGAATVRQMIKIGLSASSANSAINALTVNRMGEYACLVCQAQWRSTS